MASKVNLKGFAELGQFMQTLVPRLQENIGRGAGRAAANVIAARAREECPIGLPSVEGAELYGLHEGSMQESIRTGSRITDRGPIGYVRVGGKGKWGNVFFSHIVEFNGARPHVIGPTGWKHKKAISFNDIVRNSVNHPGMSPKPFMRTALDSTSQEAVLAAGQYIKNRLESGGLDVPDVSVQEEE